MSQYLGDISAYALAVSQGYTGTEEEYAELMASYATVGQTAVTAAQTATTKASEAATSATTATNKATEATTAATTATNKAAEAQADADAAALDASQAMSAASTATTKATEATTAAATAVSAKDDAVSANTAAQSAKTAAQTAQAGAETAAASVEASAAQIATNTEDIESLKSELTDVFESYFDAVDLPASDTVRERGISVSGGVQYDADKTASVFPVKAGDIIYIDVEANSGSASTTWIFTTNSTVGSLSASGLVGEVHSGAFSGYITVPPTATYLAVAQATGTSYAAQKLNPKEYEKQIQYIANGAYAVLKGKFAVGSILNGSDTTTTTRVRHASPISYDHDVTMFLKPGFKCYLAFYEDSAGTIYKTTTSGFYTSGAPIYIGKNQYFRVCVMKSIEEAVTNIDTYIDAFCVTTQLFDNPHIYRNSNIRQVAHQGINPYPVESTGHNLAESYKNAARLGFTHGETDIVFTSDGVPVCCHDATFKDATSGTTITIASTTYEDLLTYNYYGSTISSFADVVKACKVSGIGLYIDHLDASWTATQWQTLFDVINKYGMAKNVVWLLASASTLLTEPILAWDANASFSLLLTSVPSDFASIVTWLEALKTEANTVSIDVYNSVFSANDLPTYIAQLPANITIEVWTIDSVGDWANYLPYVTGITSNRICANTARTFN